MFQFDEALKNLKKAIGDAQKLVDETSNEPVKLEKVVRILLSHLFEATTR